MRLKVSLITLTILLFSTQASAQGVVFATSEDISAFDRMVTQSKEKNRLRAESGHANKSQKGKDKHKVRGKGPANQREINRKRAPKQRPKGGPRFRAPK